MNNSDYRYLEQRAERRGTECDTEKYRKLAEHILSQLPAKSAAGFWKGIARALEVAEMHDRDKGSAWLEQSVHEHAEHAFAHIAEIFAGCSFNSHKLDEDGLTHASHGALRMVMMLAKMTEFPHD